ncbi:MAG: ATP-binding protein [Hydrogenothermaceae bacterium]|nr:ATP-binding protein [Hydrogenothermaceae bacterium]
MKKLGNLSIKIKTSTLTSLYILIILVLSISITAYNFNEKLFQEKENALKENVINLSESYKESVITSNLEKIDELVNFLRKIKSVKDVFVIDEEGKVVGGTDFRYLGLKNPDFSDLAKSLNQFLFTLKVDNFTVGKVIVFYNQEILEEEVIKDIRKVITPLLFVVSFIIVASFLGTFFISSILVSPLLTLRERILNLLSEGFNPKTQYINQKSKPHRCIENITEDCWMFSENPYNTILPMAEKASKVCINCKIFKENSGDEIHQLSYSFIIMVASLNDFIKKLEEAHKERETLSCMAAMGEMSARLAHEIKNALYSISNAASYIKQNTDDKTIKDFGRVIKDEANRLNEITISFLNFSKLLDPKFEDKDINQTILESVELLKYDCEDEDIMLSLVLDSNLKSVKHDPNLIKQVIFNLVINSIDAIKEKGTNQIDKITIKTYKIKKDNDYVRLEVEDNGIGIKRENLESIFKPFFTTKQRGTGLGLSIVYKIIHAHGGNITVESEYGQYTKFIIEIPVR